jgi:hypothetical protein
MSTSTEFDHPVYVFERRGVKGSAKNLRKNGLWCAQSDRVWIFGSRDGAAEFVKRRGKNAVIVHDKQVIDRLMSYAVIANKCNVVRYDRQKQVRIAVAYPLREQGGVEIKKGYLF